MNFGKHGYFDILVENWTDVNVGTICRKALSIEPDNNKVCNLGICLMKQGRLEEAKAMLQSVTPACNDNRWASDSHLKSYERAQEMLQELEASMGTNNKKVIQELRSFAIPGFDDLQHSSLWQPQPALPRQPRRMARSCLDQQFSQFQVDPALLATAGFGPSSSKPNTTTGVAEQSWFQQGSASGWSELDLDYPSPEDSDGNPPLNWHAETLRQRLETVSVLGNAFMSRHHPELSSDAAPYKPEPPVAPLRPKAVKAPPPGIDRAPLTFDLTNGVRNSQNVNENENSILKPLGGWPANKPTKSTTTAGSYRFT